MSFTLKIKKGEIMKGKKPTTKQGKLLLTQGLDWRDWLTQKDTSDFLQVVHRDTKEIKIIKK